MRLMPKSLLSLGVGLLMVAAAQAQTPPAQGAWRPGIHYRLVPEPQPTSVAAGKVEVSEVFWYGCGHCYALDPVLEDWRAKKAPYIEFVRVPVVWGPMHRQHAKLFYTLQALRKPELHAKVFDAVHKEGQPLADRDDMKAREMAFNFLSAHGVTRPQFDSAYDSMTVNMNVQKAERLTQELAVASVPIVFIQGKYATGVSEAGGPSQLLAVIDDLAAREKNR
jgi:protein dithiol oxidoreductase (disulfide-forming)